MRIRNASACFAVLGLSATLAIGGCAAASSGASDSSAGAAVISAGAVASAPASSAPASSGSTGVSAPASSDAAGTQASIPAAPGTAGSAVLPPTSAVAPITSGAGEVATPLPNCTPSTLKTLTAGKLVLTSAGSSAAPWFDGNPADGKGYEAAVAAAVAKELGYSAAAVSWSTADRAKVLAGTATGFDVAIGEFPTPDQTSKTVDYSTGYFSISNSVVAKAGSKASTVTTPAGLKSLRLGAVAGSSGFSSARSQTGATVGSYPTAAAALAALAGGRVDAVVLPTPTAVAASGVTVVGQLSDGDEQPTQFGLVLAKDSPLTSCVSAAIDQLRVTGVLTTLVNTWVPAAARPLG